MALLIDPSYFTKADLGLAYRKMKADLYYERGHANGFNLCIFEESLGKNLDQVYEKLTSGSLDWLSEHVGSWRIITKDLEAEDPKKEKTMPWIQSDPLLAWKDMLSKGKPTDGPKATFRVVSDHPIVFHLVTTLWLLKVGHRYDATLGKEAYGTRVRRTRPEKKDEVGNVSHLSMGTFKPYLGQFKAWRSNGIEEMKKALDADRKVVAITADVRQFYHKVGPGFLIKKSYLKAVGLSGLLTREELRFTRAIINSIVKWHEIVHRDLPSVIADPTVGLPVGLPAARLIANVALAELDRRIREDLKPIHYGRYVDDIILVMEDTKGYQSSHEVWDDILRVLGKKGSAILDWSSDEKNTSDPSTDQAMGIKVTRSYLGNGEVLFAGKKQKVFRLEGETGKALLHSIERTVQATSSEWRALPELPSSEKGLAARLTRACDHSGEDADNLRKTDVVSPKRQALALQLRDLEALERDLPPKAWKKQRLAFFEAARDQLLAPRILMETSTYAPRLLGLAVACQDFEEAKKLVERLIDSIQKLCDNCIVALAGVPDEEGQLEAKEQQLVARRWQQTVGRTLEETLCAALGTMPLSDERKESLMKLHQFLAEQQHFSSIAHTGHLDSLLRWGERLHDHDLARHPYRLTKFGEGIRLPDRRTPDEHCAVSESHRVRGAVEYAPETVVGAVGSFLHKDGAAVGELPLALVFPTRPFSISEFYFLRDELYQDGGEGLVKQWALGFRGFGLKHPPPGGSLAPAELGNEEWAARRGKERLQVPHSPSKGAQRVAITSFLTQYRSWVASVTGYADPDTDRYARLMDLVNNILKLEEKPAYVVFPELSMKPWWFLRIAGKLANSKISTIAGIEYQANPDHKAERGVANQVWCAMVTDAFEFPAHVIYRQDKFYPAIHEERDMMQKGGRRLTPLSPRDWKPVICHGDFRFGLLICNELTNIEYRQPFRGNIDALFVVEWNQDTETFASLVEASALDIHAFIIQCNNREFGDSRIRSPAKEAYARDMVRIKGGEEDYFVVGNLDVDALRSFQSAHRSPNGPFKPVPTGFTIGDGRGALPKS
ncbi:hypothetical protein BH09SUM1_BH09SUM1_01130 [soil metagenome]